MRTPIPIAFLAALSVLAPLAGCGDSGGPDPKAEAQRMNAAVEMRALFDKAGGDYDRLEPNDKTSFDRLAGGADKAASVWTAMKYGPAGAPPANTERPDTGGQP